MSTLVHSRSTAMQDENVVAPSISLSPDTPPGPSLSQASTSALRSLVAELENDASLVEYDRVRERLNALDRLDNLLPFSEATDGIVQMEPELAVRTQAIRDTLEARNASFYEDVRRQIRRRLRPVSLLQSLMKDGAEVSVDGPAYDCIDDVIGGVFEFEEPQDDLVLRHPERLFYQPTPARHIFRLISRMSLASSDVFVDLGSGLGHVPLMVSVCTEARSLGIEIEEAYVACSRECAQRLNLDRVTFLQGDALETDLSLGTVFYLYTPFMGSVLRGVLDRLRHEAATRVIRICSFGPCTPVIAAEPWLTATNLPDADSIAVFSSCR